MGLLWVVSTYMNPSCSSLQSVLDAISPTLGLAVGPLALMTPYCFQQVGEIKVCKTSFTLSRTLEDQSRDLDLTLCISSDHHKVVSSIAADN